MDQEIGEEINFIGIDFADGVPVFDLWSTIGRTGDELTDIELGKKYAATVIQIAQFQQSSEFIARVLAALARKNCIGPLEASFLLEIAKRAYVGAHN